MARERNSVTSNCTNEFILRFDVSQRRDAFAGLQLLEVFWLKTGCLLIFAVCTVSYHGSETCLGSFKVALDVMSEYVLLLGDLRADARRSAEIAIMVFLVHPNKEKARLVNDDERRETAERRLHL